MLQEDAFCPYFGRDRRNKILVPTTIDMSGEQHASQEKARFQVMTKDSTGTKGLMEKSLLEYRQT
jgi:hypothetical protein